MRFAWQSWRYIFVTGTQYKHIVLKKLYLTMTVQSISTKFILIYFNLLLRLLILTPTNLATLLQDLTVQRNSHRGIYCLHRRITFLILFIPKTCKLLRSASPPPPLPGWPRRLSWSTPIDADMSLQASCQVIKSHYHAEDDVLVGSSVVAVGGVGDVGWERKAFGGGEGREKMGVFFRGWSTKEVR